MDSSDFPNPNGTFEHNQSRQLTFIPRGLPPDIQYDSKLVMLLAKAERKVGELKGIGDKLVNPHILIRAHLKREAVLSSKIEGTLTSLEDLNKYEAVGNIEKDESEYKRFQEVANYAQALEESIEKIKTGAKIDLQILCDAHRQLFRNVRGKYKSPGEFRTIQNMIGKIQGGRSEIIYRPPPPEQVQELTRDLEAFFQAGHDISPLIQCAMIHYQFEAIHPFLDGNGRIGRLILPLILCEKKIFSNPLLYLSAYFEKHQQEYYNGLLAVSQKSEWREWIEFFLVAFTEQAEETIRNIQEQQKVHKKYETTLKEKKTGTKTVFLLEHLIANPYITIPNAQEILKTSYPTAKNAIMSLVEAGILTEIAVIRGKKVFFAEEMDKILEC